MNKVIKKEDLTVEAVNVSQHIRKELIQGFDNLKVLKESGQLTDGDLDYELARDRKAALIFKSIVIEIGIDKIKNRRVNQ